MYTEYSTDAANTRDVEFSKTEITRRVEAMRIFPSACTVELSLIAALVYNPCHRGLTRPPHTTHHTPDDTMFDESEGGTGYNSGRQDEGVGRMITTRHISSKNEVKTHVEGGCVEDRVRSKHTCQILEEDAKYLSSLTLLVPEHRVSGPGGVHWIFRWKPEGALQPGIKSKTYV